MSTMPIPAHSDPHQGPRSSGGRLLSPDGRCLPFRGGSLTVDAAGGLCRVVLRQRFVNPYKQPLRVVYQVPLPADAAVAGYAFDLQDQHIVGQVEGRQAARERFEEAILDGRTAALLEQDRSSLFTQEIGNLPGGTEIVCELLLDQALQWEPSCDPHEDLAGGWTWRFPTVVAPRFLGQDGRVPDSARVVVDVAETGTDARLTLSLRIRDALTGPARSPSHGLHR
ncbi:MAG: hypothetical protein GXP62_02980, partial [Oligoflexia bacterium]|nr:hypothetical protein [Oligoflexia bacterium]